MEITITELGPCRKKVAADIPVERVKEEFDKNYRELSQGANIRGFRKGKVPRGLLRRRFGDKVHEQVRATLLHELLMSMVKDHKIEMVKEPDIDVEAITVAEDASFQLEMELETRPDFEIGEYKGLEVERATVELDESRVDEQLEALRRKESELAPVDGEAIVDGDHLIVDVVLSDGDEEAHRTDNAPLLVREDREIAHIGLSHGELLGKKVGDELTGECELGDTHPEEELRGKKLAYTVTINAHKRRELPELDEDFFGLFDCESLDELKDRIRDGLRHELEHDAEHVMIDQIVDQLLDGAEFELPESVMEHERARRRSDLELELRQADDGLDEAELEAKLEDKLKEVEPELQRKIRETYVLERIARDEDIEATDEEADHRIAGMAQANQMWPSEFRQMLEQRGLLDQIYSSITLHKAQHFLLDHAKISGEDAEDGAASESGADDDDSNEATPEGE